jgi:hypothetical protein
MTMPTPEVKVDANLSQEKVETPAQTQQQTQAPAVATETQEDPNWKAFREARKQDRLQREAAEKRASEKAAEAEALKAAMEAILNKQQPQQQYQQQGYQEEETEDQRIEKKVQAAIAQREAVYEQQRIQREQQEYPMKLQQTFSDFNQTIAQENLDYLDYHYPEVSRPLQRLQDGYDKWSDIYKAVKKFVPNTDHKKESARAEANFNKPKSSSSTGMTQSGEGMSSSNILTEERKAANWARMQKARKGLS